MIITKSGSAFIFWLACFLYFSEGCKNAVKEQDDEIYSRHLQRHVKLSIVSTPMPNQKPEMNLLLFNNANDLEHMDVKKILDSLYSRNLLQPVIIVAIHGKEKEEYGFGDLTLSGQTGSKAVKYRQFIINELYPFIKKKAATRKFKSIAICGNSLGGVSAFDIAWENADKINKVGIFSGMFNYAGDEDDKNTVLENIRISRKRPRLQYWFYAAGNRDAMILSNTKLLAQMIEKKNLAISEDIQIIADGQGNNDHQSWRQHFPGFLLWAFGKE